MKPTKIGIWASSSPAKLSEIQNGINFLLKKNIGFSFTEKDKLLAATPESKLRPYLASNEQNKILSLEILANDSSVKNILAVRGGYGSIRLLKFLTKSILNKLKSKMIWGFSDLTSLQNALYFINGTKWVHSPMLTSDAFMKPNAVEKKYWQTILEGNSDFLSYTMQSEGVISTKELNRIQNRVMLGGNLACFAALCGSGSFFKAPKKPYVLFLEDIAEKPHRIDRLLVQLELAKAFDHCAAIVLGHFTDCGEWLGVFKSFAKDKNIPLFWGLKVGHDRPNLPISMGQKISIVKKSARSYLLKVPNSKFE